MEENKKRLKEFKEKQENDRQRALSEQKTALEKQQESKKKENDGFLKKQAEKLNKAFEEKKKERSLENQKKQESLALKQAKELERKKNVSQTLEKERAVREKERLFREKLKDSLLIPEISQVFKKFNEELTHIYNYFRENTDITNEKLSFKGFMNFSVQFLLCPQVVSYEKMQLFFNYTTKEKDKEAGPLGVDFQEFLQLLLRVGIKGKKAFDFLAENSSLEGDKSEDIIKNIEDIEKGKDEIDDLEGIQNLTASTVEGMMKYLDFPMDKAKMNNKLRDLKLKNEKVQAPRDKKKEFVNKLVEKKREKSEDFNQKLANNENKTKHSKKTRIIFFKNTKKKIL